MATPRDSRNQVRPQHQTLRGWSQPSPDAPIAVPAAAPDEDPLDAFRDTLPGDGRVTRAQVERHVQELIAALAPTGELPQVDEAPAPTPGPAPAALPAPAIDDEEQLFAACVIDDQPAVDTKVTHRRRRPAPEGESFWLLFGASALLIAALLAIIFFTQPGAKATAAEKPAVTQVR